MVPRFPNVDRKIDLAELNATAVPFDNSLKIECFGPFSTCRDAYTGATDERNSVRNLPILTVADGELKVHKLTAQSIDPAPGTAP
jgi:hypothetical protein